jgi:predicted transposase YbfD/YdcC
MVERIPSLATIVAQIPDPRARRGRRHPWTALLLLVIVGLLSGANSQQALARFGARTSWARRHQLGFARRAAPSVATIHRALRGIDVLGLERSLSAWQQQVRIAWYTSSRRWLDGIALDGKTLRGAQRLGAHDAHLLSACCQRWGVVLGQVAVSDATNELGGLNPLLEQVLVAGETLTFDALFTQISVAEAVVARGGDYLMVIKGNQPTLLRACAEATADHPKRPRRPFGHARSVRLAHGRLEHRTLLAVRAPPDLGFPFARQILRLERRVVSKRTGEVLSEETVYGVTSLTAEQANASQLLKLWRTHWQIESLHWLRDAVFREDQSTTRTGHAPEALAAFRNLAISLIHRWRGSRVTEAREYYAAHPAHLFRRLGLTPAGL